MWIKKTPEDLDLENTTARRRAVLLTVAFASVLLSAMLMRSVPGVIAILLAMIVALLMGRNSARQRARSVFVCDSCNIVRKTLGPDCPCGGNYTSLAEMKWEVPSLDPQPFSANVFRAISCPSPANLDLPPSVSLRRTRG